jgi:uncharacterized protein (UPF0335 family)
MTNSRLQSIVTRIEKLEEERKALNSDISDIYSEAKGNGYNVKALRRIVRERKQDAAEKAEIDAAMDAYRVELGMVADAVRKGDMSLRQAAEQSGFSKSAIHREVSHRENDTVSGTDDDLEVPAFLKRTA